MKKYLMAFTYAWMGIWHGVLYERNVKSHLAAAAAVLAAGLWTGLSRTEWIIIVIVIGLMIALELMNAAVERTVDLVTGEWHPLAKQAKDLAAGAVLVFAIASAVTGAIIFLPKWFD
ncbi:diacylglycerol kinase family protein [Sporosarcina trichiuri]|uniref:diacylglycerol kinase family protein n=2 Tax=Sporosarcina TaxID=1569 RepID=UPI00058E25F7|nr:diacylglycerol kinase family protein [Sporosarcina sp. 0.2-SM1T-5]WJY28499.1 diacylglycerol kinase family protein [Sporosarcina sp. 0.2-SM1T-5]